MEKEKLQLVTRLVCADAAGVIEALAEGLKERCLKIQKGDQTMVLNPPEAVDIELEAKIKEGRGKVSLEISWRVTEEDCPAGDAAAADMDAADTPAEAKDHKKKEKSDKKSDNHDDHHDDGKDDDKKSTSKSKAKDKDKDKSDKKNKD